MWLARYQQHAQLVAHAVDHHDRAIMHGGELSFDRCRLDLDDVLPRMRDRHAHADRLADPHVAALQRLAVAPYGDRRVAGRNALVDDAERDRLRLADNAEAWGGDERHAAVALVLVAGDQGVHRCIEAQRPDVGRNVVHAAVSDHMIAPAIRSRGTSDNAEESALNRRVPSVLAAVRLAGLDEPHLEPGPCGPAARRAQRVPPRSAACDRPAPGSGSCR